MACRILFVLLLILDTTAAGAQPTSLPAASDTASPAAYATLSPLIGEWNVGPEGAPAAFIERFSWGTSRAYIWLSVALVQDSGSEHLHVEGPIVWNAASRRYDYLFSVEPGSLVQEKGEIYAVDGGVIVRDVLLTAADGATSRFRQTFRTLDGGRMETSLMRQTADGWVPTFPGSERLIMERRED
jgi:hypothetical protein